jgi:hypothetical protein
MPDPADYELFKTPEDYRPGPARRRVGLWVAGVLLVAAIAIAVWFVYGRQTSTGGTQAPARVEAPAEPGPSAPSLGGAAEPIVLPPLDQTDAAVRELVKQLTSHPQIAAWLATDDLIRNFVVVVANIAEGKAPASQLRALRPATRLQVAGRGGGLYLDPRSYERYDGLAAAVASIDPAGAARLYATLKPRIADAYRELGVVDTTFDATLERAIVVLLGTPAVEGAVRPAPKGIGYAFVRPDLESLPAAQKQLVRMGPGNAQAVQSSLRQIALALGIPADRLPPAT